MVCTRNVENRKNKKLSIRENQHPCISHVIGFSSYLHMNEKIFSTE